MRRLLSWIAVLGLTACGGMTVQDPPAAGALLAMPSPAATRAVPTGTPGLALTSTVDYQGTVGALDAERAALAITLDAARATDQRAAALTETACADLQATQTATAAIAATAERTHYDNLTAIAHRTEIAPQVRQAEVRMALAPAWEWGKLIGLVIALAAFWTFVRYVAPAVADRIRPAHAYDHSGDGQARAESDPAEPAAEEQPRAVRVLLDMTRDGTFQRRYIDLPVEVGQMVALARGLKAGLPFSVATWVGEGKPFSRGAYERLRGVMLENKLIELIDDHEPRRGYNLTLEGRAWLDAWANDQYATI